MLRGLRAQASPGLWSLVRVRRWPASGPAGQQAARSFWSCGLPRDEATNCDCRRLSTDACTCQARNGDVAGPPSSRPRDTLCKNAKGPANRPFIYCFCSLSDWPTSWTGTLGPIPGSVNWESGAVNATIRDKKTAPFQGAASSTGRKHAPAASHHSPDKMHTGTMGLTMYFRCRAAGMGEVRRGTDDADFRGRRR